MIIIDSKREKDITIYDIAEMAGVSPATVSRVMTQSARVSPEKEAKVQEIIDKYNYRPNALARSLSDTQTRTLGVMVADIRNPYYAELAVACENAANRRGYNVFLSNILEDHVKEREILERFYEQRVDSIIQIGSLTDDLQTDVSYAAKVREITKTIPFVTTGNLENVDCYGVNIDQKMAMAIVMDYLVNQGHKEIAFIGGRNTVTSTYRKWQEYIYMLGKHKLPFREEYVQAGDYSTSAGKKGISNILRGSHLPTAVIAINDYAAVGVAKKLEEEGFRIPKDISLISFDNTYLTEITATKLTSIDYGYEAYGEKLVEVAIDAATGKKVERKHLIVPTLVERESCSPPK